MLISLPLMLSTGCTSADQVEVYLFFLGQQETLSENASLSHNFTGAYEPSDSDDWTRSEDSKTSAAATFGELVTMGDSTALLQISGQSYPGTGDKGSWTFSWEDFDRGSTQETHSAGYTFQTDYDNSRSETITLTEGSTAGTFTGDWTTTTVLAEDQSEDDTWSVDVGLTVGNIDVAGRLLVEDQFGAVSSASNFGQETDCDGSPCLLKVETSTEFSRTVQAILTDYTPEDLERNAGDYGQQGGF